MRQVREANESSAYRWARWTETVVRLHEVGDHGGGQPDVYRTVADRLDARYAPQGIHVYYCDEVYTKAQADFEKWLADHGYPPSQHAGIPDTSEMLYLGGDA